MTPQTPIEPNQTPSPNLLNRRCFLERMSLWAGGVSAALVAAPMVGFLLAPLLRTKPRIWRDVGALDDFAIGATTDVTLEDASPLPWAGVTAKTAAWLRRESQEGFTAFAVNCSHLGCPVTWLPDASLFMCPCHGGVYNRDGSVAAGPPPRPLKQYPVRIRSGRVEIETTALPVEGA
ncbi:MAG: Rieske (2Fe-2S) protein [Caldilineaceae bacterium]